MNITSVSLHLTTPRAVVFSFLRDLRNLPVWATEFCESVGQWADGWVIHTEHGTLCADVTADESSGVIDMWSGPDRAGMALFPLRVSSLPGGGTLVIFTFVQPADLPDELYAIQYQSLLVEMRVLAERFGGTLHAPLSAFNADEAVLA